MVTHSRHDPRPGLRRELGRGQCLCALEFRLFNLAEAEAVQAAEGYRYKRINEAEGDIASFNAVLEQYIKAPQITRTRIYLETMGEVLPRAGQKLIVDDALKQWLPMMSVSPKLTEGKQ